MPHPLSPYNGACNIMPSGATADPSPPLPFAGRGVQVYEGDNMKVIGNFPDESFPLIYIDPPFNTGRVQTRQLMTTQRDALGDRTGYKGQQYRTTIQGGHAYNDQFDDYPAFIAPRMQEAFRLL
ncbi:MAG: site-specific DNA-methyltransferase, partial [Alphaproteobacteria bacterium]|nr:site-specific DNA-methyltransferase [Alphaproteobacteria bacterium]